jgi:hypothetical protein
MAGRDALAAWALLALAVAGAVESARLLPYGVVRNPGPGFYPWWVSLALGVLALVLLGQWLLAARHVRPGEDGRFVKVVGVLAVLTVYAVLLEPVGYPIATFVLVLFMLRVTDPQRWPVAFGMGLLAAGGSYVLFGVWLGVPLPAGLLTR